MELPKTVRDLNAWDRNPREIDDESLQALGTSMKTFGDLSGVCYNVHPDVNALVCGHQRRQHLPPDAPIENVVEAKDEHGTVGYGYIRDGHGGSWRVRLVYWEPVMHAAACVAANNELLVGRFNDQLPIVVKPIWENMKALAPKLRMPLPASPIGMGFDEPENMDAPEVDKFDDPAATGRFIITYDNEEERERILEMLGVDGEKVLYTVSELHG